MADLRIVSAVVAVAGCLIIVLLQVQHGSQLYNGSCRNPNP